MLSNAKHHRWEVISYNCNVMVIQLNIIDWNVNYTYWSANGQFLWQIFSRFCRNFGILIFLGKPKISFSMNFSKVKRICMFPLIYFDFNILYIDECAILCMKKIKQCEKLKILPNFGCMSIILNTAVAISTNFTLE